MRYALYSVSNGYVNNIIEIADGTIIHQSTDSVYIIPANKALVEAVGENAVIGATWTGSEFIIND